MSEPGQVYEAVKTALNLGYRHIDEAWIYGNEEEVGKAFREVFAEGKIKREDVWVTTKLWNCFHRPNQVMKGFQESLTKLGLDYVDLFLMHFPVSFKPGVSEATKANMVEEVPLADTWKEMEKLVDAGLCRNIGVSNFEIKDIKVV